MRSITLEELLEAGCHFGHQVTRQNPKSADFVFEARDNIHIIDLEKTKEGLENAAAFIKQIAQNPESTLVVLGTKRQAEGLVREEYERATKEGVSGIYTVTARWIGGTFSNFAEVTKNYKKLKDISEKLKNEFEKMKYTKKEISLWEKERQKLERYYGGAKDMLKIPDAIFVIDTHTESLAVREAQNMGVKVIGIVDTNADPDPVDYVIPANDDASGSIKLILSYIIDAWIEGKKKAAKEEEKAANSKDLPAGKAGLMANGEQQKQDTMKPEVTEAKAGEAKSVEQEAKGSEQKTKKAKKNSQEVKSESVKSEKESNKPIKKITKKESVKKTTKKTAKA